MFGFDRTIVGGGEAFLRVDLRRSTYFFIASIISSRN